MVTNDTYTDRYLSRYETQDFRGYTGTGNGAFFPKFYKYIPASVTYSDLTTSVIESITVNATPVSIPATGDGGTLSITYENLTISDAGDFDIQYYDAEGNELNGDSEPDWIVAAVEADGSSYVVSYIVEENTQGGTRTAYFKVMAPGATDFVYSDLITFTQAAPVVSVTVTSAGFATYCCDKALDFTNAGIKAYVGTLSGTALTFTPVTTVPANTGLLLVKDGGATEDIPVAASAQAVQNNCLVGTLVEKTLDAKDYILNVVDGKAGFYLANTYTTLAAHRAYIPALTGGQVKSFAINLDEADAISAVKAVNGNADIFNLAGQRVSKAQKGIYIVNGKKVLVK